MLSFIGVEPVAMEVLLAMNCIIVSIVIGILGIIGNIINIIIFTRQGFDDSINITLMALAISDLGALIASEVMAFIANPWFLTSNLPLVTVEFVHMVAFYPHNYCIRVCGFITAFAAFERCLCVSIPLKIKQIVTRKVTFRVIIFIFLITLLDMLPVYYVAYLDWIVLPGSNSSKLGMVFRENPYNVFGVSYLITDMFIPYFTFFIIILSNVIIAWKLKARYTWRKSITKTHSDKGEGISNKEKKTVLTLVVVSIIFIVCLMPQSAVLTVVSQVPELSIRGSKFDLTILCLSFAYVLECLSSSVNIVVYYKMSSRYRETCMLFLSHKSWLRRKKLHF
ncbi:neuropeptides capa receptor-like [Physella acuta]|uniref:neuropeptides capa receptor-like n=1 Tax=Physella acuta TaxID=109671 RepID=UPI0027DDC874|nr:neuropeptides capa receptor-like [Physella acuta]